MSRYLPFAAAFLIGIAAVAMASGPRPNWTEILWNDCPSSAQPRLASSGPRLATGAIF